ncbi:MAG: hypothetical protein VR64_19065 [Desulfatitalea sp. BRH_c12]|nr:MAG: hypothetical protein VR64_19065 [Desulfatitalea sp. BRH_c12]
MRSHPTNWTDMSNYVVHFTKGGPGKNDYNVMMSIYASGTLKPGRSFGIGINKAPLSSGQGSVCFSEIPPGQWNRLEERRGTKYGLAFRKQFVISQGGGPIWYAWKDTPHWQALQAMMDAAAEDPDALVWRITPMIDAPGTYRGRDYQFEWEREWRHLGPIQFEPEDVAFLLIPEEQHAAARGFFENAYYENLGPAYFCPYVDPSWERERIIEALNT